VNSHQPAPASDWAAVGAGDGFYVVQPEVA